MNMNLKRPRGFLRFGGGIIFIIGLLGIAGLMGPSPAQSIFHSYWWLGERESLAFFIVGLALVFISFAAPAILQRYIVIIFGIFEILIGLYVFFDRSIFGISLENPSDLMLHLFIGGWALYSVYGKNQRKR